VLGVAAQVPGDERAERHQLEAAAAQVRERAGDEARAEPLPFEGRVDVGVDQDDCAGLTPVGEEARPRLPEPELRRAFPGANGAAGRTRGRSTSARRSAARR
jgi:hypothetical protein